MEENAAGGAFTTGNGPLGFDTSLKLDGTGCMSQQNWAHVNDPCAKNPADCEEGFSFSLWVRLELEDVASMFEEDGTEAPQGPKRYLLSTGGDDSGHPGVAIYLQSHSLSALVSTGDQYWLSSVTGLVRNNTWNNIGVRWSKEGSDGMEAGGLQLLINNSTEGYTVVPEASKEAAKSGLNPGEVMVGCHRTAGNMAYRHKTAAEFDEVAMWTRPLADNETLFFLGGFDSDDKDLDMEKLRIMFKKCVQCRENPVQFKAFISKALVSAKTAPEPASPTVPSTASAEGQAGAGQQPEAAVNLPPDVEQAPPEKVEKIKSLAMLMYDLTDSCKSPMGQDELKDFLEIGALLDETMEMKTLSQWRTVEYSSKEDGGAATVVTRLEKWALDCSSHMVMQPKDRVFVDKQLNNMEMQVEKMKTFNFQEIPIITYPRGKDRRELNTVSFTPELFEQDQECRFVDMSTMFMRYDTYGRISPKRASLIEMDTSDEEMLEVDGQVLSMQVKLNGDLDGTDAYKVANCTPSEERLRTYPVLLTIGHSSPRKALRKPLFHQDEINTGILRRVCVWWNPELSDYGSWDADGCTAIESNEYFTKCRCAHFGQYAIMIEKVPPKVVEIEYQWLQIIKYVCYTISALLLLIFIIAVAKIKQLHEMFHLMRLQTALGLLVGSVFMCMTDIPEIRDSRHACVAFGAIIQVFYLVASMMVMMEGLADFLSMTTGAIGGKLKSYTAISWGVPPLSLGYAFLMYLHDYGTDPRCMLGWPDNVKLTMFVPMMVAMTATAILTALVTCNMQASKLRKENIVAEQLTVCKGYVFFAFFFVVTWVVGVLAYLQLGLQIPSFYPLFQILNSTNGIVFFLFCGVGSERFRLLLTGKAALRRKMLLSYTVSEQLPPAQQPQEEPPRPPTPPEAAPYDPEARAPRKPLVA